MTRVTTPDSWSAGFEPGRDGWFTVTLEPGRYLLLCAINEEEGRHFDLGMIYRFTIE